MANSLTEPLFDMSLVDVYEELGKAQQELLNLRFQLATRQNSNYARVRIAKRQVARVKTILHERSLTEGEV